MSDTPYQKNLGCPAGVGVFLKTSPKDVFFKFIKWNKGKTGYCSHFSCPVQKARDCSNHTGPYLFVWCYVHWLQSLTRKRSYPNFAWHQIDTDLLKCWVGHKVGSGGAAQPRKVGQPKPSISSAAQLQSKKERKKERERGRENRNRESHGEEERETRDQCPLSAFWPR